MTVVSLDLAKQHMKVDGTAEDELISLYLDAAETWCGNYINQPIADLDPVPADVKTAILKLVSFHYEHRNIASFGVSVQMAPHGIATMLNPYVKGWFGDVE